MNALMQQRNNIKNGGDNNNNTDAHSVTLRAYSCLWSSANRLRFSHISNINDDCQHKIKFYNRINSTHISGIHSINYIKYIVA